MASFNKVILMGNLTRDPEVRQSQSGTMIGKMGIAVNDRVPDGQGGWNDKANFFDVTFFGRQAENLARWFSKGRPILVEGRLSYHAWEDKESGQKRSKVEVIGDRWHFVGGRDAQGGGGGGAQGPDAYSQAPSQAQPQGSGGGGGGGGGDFPSRDDFVPDDVPF